MAVAEPVSLTVDISSGELEVVYNRDGQVSIAGFAKTSGDANLDNNYFSTALTVEQDGNHLSIRQVSTPAYDEAKITVAYRIDVPYRTELTSKVSHGNQTIGGILGPVKAVTGKGDIKASYISKAFQAEVENGNLNLQAMGEHVDARAGTGNISGERLAQGIGAETGDGDITLMMVGASTAVVKKGNGRIEVGGARGSLSGSTDAGDIHVRAIPHDDWQLKSLSGTVRIELPPVARFELDASTKTGELQFDRGDILDPASDLHHISTKLNGGGKRIDVFTGTGKIVVR